MGKIIYTIITIFLIIMNIFLGYSLYNKYKETGKINQKISNYIILKEETDYLNNNYNILLPLIDTKRQLNDIKENHIDEINILKDEIINLNKKIKNIS